MCLEVVDNPLDKRISGYLHKPVRITLTSQEETLFGKATSSEVHEGILLRRSTFESQNSVTSVEIVIDGNFPVMDIYPYFRDEDQSFNIQCLCSHGEVLGT